MAPEPAPALNVEGECGVGNSQSALKSEDDGERSVAPDGGPVPSLVPGEFRSDESATAVCEDVTDPSDAPALAVEVDGQSGGGKKNLGKVLVKSEPVHCEGEGAFLAPCTGLAGAHLLGVASSSYRLPVASPEHSADERGGDSTECSSSFGDSFCETGDEVDNGDLEVNSPFSVHADGGQASALPRKKKVTAEWRNAVRPMLWRCEWLELRMKDLLSQVSKYDSQLALIKQEKELQRAVSKTNGCRKESGKSCRGRENISMERRKRKRHEDTVDTSLYLKKHKILSYFLDKQNKGAEADGLLIDDDSHGSVGDDTRRRLEIVGLPASKEYDMVSNQFMLQKILLKIGGIQSRVHRLQERLSKAHSKEAKLASFMDHGQVKVAEKRQRIQKRAFSPENDLYAKPQKKKKVHILLEQDDRPAPSVKPTLAETATGCLTEDPQGNSEEKALERSEVHKKAITVDLLLGAENSLPKGHLGDLCKENTDDILIDNRGAKEGYQPFENVKHPLEKPPVLAENVAKTAPPKVGNTAEPVEAEKNSVPLVKQEVIIERPLALKHVYSIKKRGRAPKTEGMGSEAASKNQSKEAFETSAKQKAETTPCTLNENTGSKKQETVDIRSPSKKLNSGNSCSAATKLKIVNPSSAVKAQKTGNSSSAAKTPKTGNSSSDGNMQAAGNSSSAAKKPKIGKSLSDGKMQEAGNSFAAAKSKTGNSSSDGKKQAAGNSSASAKSKTGNSSSYGKKQAAGNSSASARKEMSENIPTNLRIEKAILVEVNSRRSRRVRKPKVY